MGSTSIQLKHAARYIEELEHDNSELREEIAELKRINSTLYANVERFVSRKTINDFPIDDPNLKP